jgi:hypothetical protein
MAAQRPSFDPNIAEHDTQPGEFIEVILHSQMQGNCMLCHTALIAEILSKRCGVICLKKNSHKSIPIEND